MVRHGLIIILLSLSDTLCGQGQSLTFKDVVDRLALACPAAEVEHLNYASTLLEFENYKKSLLPSFSLNLSPLSFNRSMKLIQQATDGTYYNVDDYTFSTGIGVSVSQQVGFTGGTLSASTDLNYLNEISTSRENFSTTPFFLSYSQPLWGGGRSFRYGKELEYKRNSMALKEYGATLAGIQSHAAGLYLEALSSQIELSFSEEEAGVSDSLLIIAKQRLDNGETTEMEYRHALIQKSNSAWSLGEARQKRIRSLRSLCDYLAINLNESSEVTLSEPVVEAPLLLSYDHVEDMALVNGTFRTNQEIARIEAEQSLFNTKKDAFLGGSISLNYGTNQYANVFSNAYSNPNTRQYASLSFTIPAFQWGAVRNRIKMSENRYKKSMIAMEKNEREYFTALRDQVEEYNRKASLFVLAKETYVLSREQGDLFLARFRAGMTSMSDYHALLLEQAAAAKNYLSALTGLWTAYYGIRETTLYDFILKRNLVDVYVADHAGKKGKD